MIEIRLDAFTTIRYRHLDGGLVINLLFRAGPANKLGVVCVGSNITLLIVGSSSKPAPSIKNSRPPDIETIDKTPFAVSFLCLRPWSGSAID